MRALVRESRELRIEAKALIQDSKDLRNKSEASHNRCSVLFNNFSPPRFRVRNDGELFERRFLLAANLSAASLADCRIRKRSRECCDEDARAVLLRS